MRTVLKDGEKLIIEVKRHWIVLMTPIVISVGIIVGFFTITSYPQLSVYRSFGGFVIIIAPLYFLYKFYDREVDIWAVTSLRVIDEWGIFTRNTRESPLERINNVAYKQPLMGIILGYGNVTIQTAADHGDTTIGFANRPKMLKDAIAKAQSEFNENIYTPRDEKKMQAGTIECPWCAELIKAKAKICRFCRKEIITKKRSDG